LRYPKNSFQPKVKVGMFLTEVITTGSDAGSSYIATLRFSRTEIKGRKVVAGEFKETAWEDIPSS
jgi:hypothetical protein